MNGEVNGSVANDANNFQDTEPQDTKKALSTLGSFFRRSGHNAKWWYSTVHIVTAMVGAGVLSLPSAMANLGWAPGMLMLSISWIVTLATMYQMIELHEDETNRYDTYQALGRLAFGEKRGSYIVGSQQVIVQVTTNIAYLVTGGNSMKRFYDLVIGRTYYCRRSPAWVWIAIFTTIQAILSASATFSSMTIVSLVASVMSFSYSTIVWATSISHKRSAVSYDYPRDFKYYDAFNALGEMAFAYGGHNVVLEIQATMRSTREKPSKLPMWNGVLVAYLVVAICYFPVAGVGYWAFGNLTCFDNVLEVLGHPRPVIAAANFMLILHLTGSYQVYALPIYDSLEGFVEATPLRRYGMFVRPLYVVLTGFLASLIPFFGALLGLFGGLALAPSTYFLPCIMWLVLKKPRRFGLEWLLNWGCIIFGVALMVVSFVGSLAKLIQGFENGSYEVFHFTALGSCDILSGALVEC